jgi:hypothetical protein
VLLEEHLGLLHGLHGQLPRGRNHQNGHLARRRVQPNRKNSS